MEAEKKSITLNAIVSEIFKWIGFAWTGMSILFSVQFLMSISEAEKITRLELHSNIYDFALQWAIVAVPAFVAAYFGKK